MSALPQTTNGRFAPAALASLSAPVQLTADAKPRSGVVYIGCAPTAKLELQQWYRVTFERSAWEKFDAGWKKSMNQVFRSIAGTNIAVPVSPQDYDEKGSVAVVDLKSTSKTHTVVQLVNALNTLSPGLVLKEVAVTQIEKVASPRLVSGATGAAARDGAALKAEERQQEDSTFGKLKHDAESFLDKLKSLGTVAYWAVVLLIVGGVVVLLWQFHKHGIKGLVAG